MYVSGGKYSEELAEGSNHVSVSIMMSGWILFMRISKSGFLFFIDWKFILIILMGGCV